MNAIDKLIEKWGAHQKFLKDPADRLTKGIYAVNGERFDELMDDLRALKEKGIEVALMPACDMHWRTFVYKSLDVDASYEPAILFIEED